MGRRYKLAHLITRLDLGGAQQNTLFCAEHHDRSRFDVALIAGAGGILDDEARALSDTRVSLLPGLEHRISVWRDLRAVFCLRKLLREEAIDLLHTHSSKAGVLGRFAALLAGVPVVVHTAHGWSFNPTQSAWTRRFYVLLERLAAAVTDRLVMVSDCSRRIGLALGIGRSVQYSIVHSGIDVESYRRPGRDRESMRRSLDLEPDQLLVGTIACLKPQKAPLDFVEAAAAAYGKNDRLRFVVAGDGELRDSVQRRIDELGLSGVVRLLGWRRDVPELLQAMDVFLLTSRFEGLPRSVLQAMAAGVAVVATDVDGTPEVVVHGRTGLLAPPGEPALAAERVLELAADPALRRSCTENARRLLGEEFEIHRMVKQLEAIYLFHLEARDR